MWCIREKKKKDNVYNIKPGETLKIGRKSADIILENDSSISRMHALIEVKKQDDNSSKICCFLTDVGSRYGTQIIGDNSIKLTANKPQELKHNDIIQFGLDQYFFQVECIPFVVLTSGLNKDDKIQLSKILDKTGGNICNQWTSYCTHLTVTEAKITQKLASCLATGIPIVTIKFWQAVENSIDKKTTFPNICDYCPELDDQLLRPNNINLLPLPQRKNVFKELLFIFFLKKQYNIYKEMISLAGGEAIYFNDREISKKELSNKNTILIQFDQNDSQNEEYEVPNFSKLEKFYKKLERRLIPETDIPLAILHCSVEKSCNPYYSYHDLLKRKNSDNAKLNASILALDTQDVGNIKVSKNPCVIPESLDFSTQEVEINKDKLSLNDNKSASSSTSSVTKKRPIEEEEEEHSKLAPIFKRSKIQTNNKSTEDSQLKSTNLEENSNNNNNNNDNNSQLKKSQTSSILSCIKRNENVIIPETIDEDEDVDYLNPSPIEEPSSIEINFSKKRKSQSVDNDDFNNFITPNKKSKESSENVSDCSKVNTQQKKQPSMLQNDSDDEQIVKAPKEPSIIEKNNNNSQKRKSIMIENDSDEETTFETTKKIKNSSVIEKNKSKIDSSCSNDNNNQKRKSMMIESNSDEETTFKTPMKKKESSIIQKKKFKIGNNLSECSKNIKQSNMLDNTDDDDDDEQVYKKVIKKSPISVRDEEELPYDNDNNESTKDISQQIKNIKIKKEENDNSKMRSTWTNIIRSDSFNTKKRFHSNRSTVVPTKPFIAWHAVPWKT